jgi:hypothetical protein
MLDASFTVLQNTNQKNGFLDLIEGPGLMEFKPPLDSWLPHSHSWMDIWSSGFACIVLILCIASLSLASDMRVWRKEHDRGMFMGYLMMWTYFSGCRWLEC